MGLRNLPLVDASVPSAATFFEAADVLTLQKVSAIAVVDADRRVVGLFGGDELIAGLFPRYLGELRHTAFARDDADLLARRAEEVGGEPIYRHLRQPVTVDVQASATHVAERFLHGGVGAIAVVEDGKFVGMLDREDFCRTVARLPAAEARG